MPQQPLHTQQLTHPRAGEVIEIESGEELQGCSTGGFSCGNTCIVSVARWQGACLQFGNADSSLPLDLLKQICLFRAHLRRDELLHRKQTTIDVNFGFR